MWHQPKPPQHQQEGFLLTHPVWDVTPFLYIISINPINFYSHIPCGMWLWKGGRNFVKHDFYSHIPCGMWPSSRIFSIASPTISTHTSRVGCDWLYSDFSIEYKISTHTSRVGCDTVPGTWLPHEGNFYSHIPCGMWLITHKTEYPLTIISTHTSRVGCDLSKRRNIQK